jgi:serine/threonine-protein kinase
MEVMATWYAIGRLFEFAGLPARASDAYKVVPGVLDAAFRLERTASGKIETNEGHWMSPRIMERGLMLRPAELPDLERLLATAGREPTPLDTPQQRDDVHAVTAEAPKVTVPPPPPGADFTPAPAEAFQHAGPGTLVDGRYQLEELIGTGGMARVYRALDTELGGQVALKLFVQLTGGSGLDRVRREMKLSRKLINPHIVRVFEYGIWKGTRYLTMELLEGHDVERLILAQDEGRLEIPEALQLMMQACEGLAAAHDAGVIHRDIKPQNLFVAAGRRLKVMDFGIAKVLGATSLSLTGVRIGTPRYMSPEQIESGHTVGPAADLYALGGVMYEAITGTPPFQDDDLMPLLLNQMAEMPEPPRYRHPGIPPEVEDIVMKLLRKDPAERYSSARELRGELLRCWIDQERIRRS